MSKNVRFIEAAPETVWKVLADGWLYPTWVVGASRMRDVEEAWPATGAQLHHSIGVWPLLIDDTTQVIDAQPPERLVLRARGWPAGEADVLIRLHARDGGTEVSITEDVVRGPARAVPQALRNLTLGWRNVETLRRLAFIAENRESSLM